MRLSDLVGEMRARQIIGSDRALSRYIGRAPNYTCENRAAGFTTEDYLVLHARLQADHPDLAAVALKTAIELGFDQARWGR